MTDTIAIVMVIAKLIKRFCDKTMLLDKGKQIALGHTEEIVDIYLKNYVK